MSDSSQLDHNGGSPNPTRRDAKDKGNPSTAIIRRTPAAFARRWGLVLAGGNGQRLQILTRAICGDSRPKQFCPLLSERTLLQHTLERTKPCVRQEQIIVSLVANHRRFYLQETCIDRSQRIIQPENRGTAPPILHGLLSIARIDPLANVVILPCDSFFSDEAKFASTLNSAFDESSQHPNQIILLGAEPDKPEIEYGWIEPLGPRDGRPFLRVRAFHEKPSARISRELFESGALWNTFVMVGAVQAFLKMACATLPGLLAKFKTLPPWRGREIELPIDPYCRIPLTDFSSASLAAQPERLRVLPLEGIGWSDLGSVERVESSIQQYGLSPWWFTDGGRKSNAAVMAHRAAIA